MGSRFREKEVIPRPSHDALVRKINVLDASPGDGDDLPYDLRIAVKPIFAAGAELRSIGMNDECAIFKAAARGEIASVTLHENIDGLLPNRL